MSALRQRAVGVARRTRLQPLRTVRTYASESNAHEHHEAPAVNESLGTAFYVFVGAIPASIFVYSISRPGADGQPSQLTKWLNNFDYFNVDLDARNALRTQIIEQAARDKHLLLHAPKNQHVELKTPELFNSGAPWNVPAGHYINLDKVTEHYRTQHLAEEERKAKKLAEREAAKQQS